MKTYLILLLTVIYSQAFGQQWLNKHQLGLSGGHEWNVFLNPATLELPEGYMAQDDLWDNGSFQLISFNNSFKYEKAKYHFKVKANGSGAIYQTEQNSNRYAYTLMASWRLKYARKKYLEIAPVYTRVRREGTNAADAILRTPFSFKKLIIPLHLDFYLGNRLWLKTQGGYLYKNYDRVIEEEELFYQSPFVEAALSKKWDSKRATNKLTIRSNSQFRKYFELQFPSQVDPDEEEEPELEERERFWNYYRNNIEYKISRKSLDFGFGIYSILRRDLEGNNSYQEFGPGLSWELQSGKKLKINGGLRYTIRNYPDLTPGSGNDELNLQYQYFRGNARISFQVKPQTSLYAAGNLVNRISNNPDQSMIGFRGYFNGLIELGAVYKF